MKNNNILFFILGILFVSLVSFKAGVSYMDVKPINPRQTMIIEDRLSVNNWKKHIANGYQVQSITKSDKPYIDGVVIVLVKY